MSIDWRVRAGDWPVVGRVCLSSTAPGAQAQNGAAYCSIRLPSRANNGSRRVNRLAVAPG